MARPCKVLLVVPRFYGESFWNLREACELYGARYPSAPLGLITVAALLPPHWDARLVNRNTEELTESDLAWADLVMTGGMLPQRPDTLSVIALAQQRGKPAVVGGPDVSLSPDAYASADFRVLGEAETVINAFVAAWEQGTRQGVFEAARAVTDVTKTPVPRFDLLKREQYLYLGVQFSRGCPFACEFCDITELYGRLSRPKTAEQMLNELEALYRSGYRGHVDFVDDNFIGNKLKVKAFLPHLVQWQKARGYPFMFSTEASINLADDDALLALMREAGFFTVFVGIESPDADTLVSIQKKQNTRRDLARGVEKIHRAGMFVNGGFIVGFDSEKGSIADAMIGLIQDTGIPVSTVGLLYALPQTQMARRLAAEGRLFPVSYREAQVNSGVGDHCTAGLNFETKRPRRDILQDYRRVLREVYAARAYYARVRKMIMLLDRPVLVADPSYVPPPRKPQWRIGPVSAGDLKLLARLVWRIARRQPGALPYFASVFIACARQNPRALEYVGIMAALYLHLGPFARYVVASVDRLIAQIDAGEWRSPLAEPPVAVPLSA